MARYRNNITKSFWDFDNKDDSRYKEFPIFCSAGREPTPLWWKQEIVISGKRSDIKRAIRQTDGNIVFLYQQETKLKEETTEVESKAKLEEAQLKENLNKIKSLLERKTIERKLLERENNKRRTIADTIQETEELKKEYLALYQDIENQIIQEESTIAKILGDKANNKESITKIYSDIIAKDKQKDN